MGYTPSQRKVIDAISREARRRYTAPSSAGGRKVVKAERRKTKAAYETSRVESNHQNLNHGDSTSVNWRQEIASSYPGVDRMNLKGSVKRFFNEADSLYAGDSAASLAARVQRPAAQYRHRYGEHRDEAINLLRQNVLGKGSPSPAKTTRKPGTLKKTEGVDRSAERQAMLFNYFRSERDKPGSLIQLSTGLKSAQDTPDKLKFVKGKKVKVKKTAPGKGGKVQGGGGWGGSKGIAYGATEGMPRGSQKRSTQNTASGNVSDHYVGAKSSYAIDVPAAGATGERYARKMAKRLGIKGYQTGNFNGYTVTGAGGNKYRVQILWNVADHHDHVHVGVKAL